MRTIATLVFRLAVCATLIGADTDPIFAPGKDWELLGQNYQLTADTTVDPQGQVYFTDARNNRIYRVDTAGKITLWKEGSGGAHGIAYGPDGRLYAAQHDRKRIVALAPDGSESVFAENVQTHHLTVTKRGEAYLADGPSHMVWLINTAGNKRAATGSLDWPHGLRLSADQSRLAVNDPHTNSVWWFQIQPDGSLANGIRFCRLQAPSGSSESDAGGMTFDTRGFLYVSSKLGVQLFDPAGRAVTILEPPAKEGLNGVFFAGPGLQWLYVTDGERIYRRLSTRRGAQ